MIVTLARMLFEAVSIKFILTEYIAQLNIRTKAKVNVIGEKRAVAVIIDITGNTKVLSVYRSVAISLDSTDPNTSFRLELSCPSLLISSSF